MELVLSESVPSYWYAKHTVAQFLTLLWQLENVEVV